MGLTRAREDGVEADKCEVRDIIEELRDLADAITTRHHVARAAAREMSYTFCKAYGHPILCVWKTAAATKEPLLKAIAMFSFHHRESGSFGIHWFLRFGSSGI